MNIIEKIANSLVIKTWQVENSIKLFDEGATIPFISRYRKEATGELNEVVLENVFQLNAKYTELNKRREYIIDTISELGKMSEVLLNKLNLAETIEQIEDLYLPYKQKRRTKATIAKENGLEGLAKFISIKSSESEIYSYANKFVNKDVESCELAIQGACHIIAEWFSEDSFIRQVVRDEYMKYGVISSKVVKSKSNEESKFVNYYDFNEQLRRIAPNRLFAILRGEREGELRVKILVDEDIMLEKLNRIYSKNRAINSYKCDAIKDGYKRLIAPSIETETINYYKQIADEKAIKIFSSNLKQLLLSSPIGNKKVLAIDPGFRTGCKLVCIDKNGDLLYNETIYPHPPKNEWAVAQKKVARLVETYKIEAIAIGDGTAGRESEKFIKSIHFPHPLEVYVVSEDGASIYSASPVARDEFPDYDVTVRGAVSIGRRLQDPLAELVKIEPKSLGVGEYQHDVDQSKLKQTLNFVVESCVNSVGVNLNSASHHILMYVSGIGETLAKNIVKYRSENGEFKSRKELKKVTRLGEKVFEQAAGFLRVANSNEPLDNSSVHPESYYIVDKMAKDLSTTTIKLIGNKELIKSIKPEKYVDNKVGFITINDIIKELAKPSVDPREKAQLFEFAQDIRTIDDLKEGRVLDGIVSNITSFGAFVDIGIKESGLVHLSQICDKFISSPTDVLSLHQQVKVKILEIDRTRKRISLTMKDL